MRGAGMERRGWRRRVARRGGVLAHVVTFTNLGCGFVALLLALENHPNQAVSLIFLAMVLDFLDGALARMAGHGSDWPWPLLAMFTVGLSALMVCRVRFVKLSRVLLPTIRRLPEEIRWTTALLAIPTIAIIVEPEPRAVVVLGAIYILFSLLDN